MSYKQKLCSDISETSEFVGSGKFPVSEYYGSYHRNFMGSDCRKSKDVMEFRLSGDLSDPTFGSHRIIHGTDRILLGTFALGIYVANRNKTTIIVWHNDSIYPAKTIDGNFTDPHSLFVTLNGDIFIDDGDVNGRVQKWEATTDTFVIVMNVNSSCYSLFVDSNDTLYCSMYSRHQVVKRSLNDCDITSMIVAAGAGFQGSGLNEFNEPWGIFVDVNFDLYVADYMNDRVQLLQSGESNGITVAGSNSPNPTFNIFRPTGIILNAGKYLFIADMMNHRIVGSSLNGFRCLVGCYEPNRTDRFGS